MSGTQDLSGGRERISAEAVDWCLRLHDEGVTESEAFTDWLMRSPMHVEEFLKISGLWRALQLPRTSNTTTAVLIDAARKFHEGEDNVVRMPRSEHAIGEPNPPASAALAVSAELANGSSTAAHGAESTGGRVSRRRWLAYAASIGLVPAAWLSYARWRAGEIYITNPQEETTIHLVDGSVVLLYAASRIRVSWSKSERHIDLLEGQARFSVAKAASRPFVVVTREAAVRVLGTVFSVRTDPMSTEVVVAEGRVQVGTQAPSLLVDHAGATTTATGSPVSSTLELVAGQGATVTLGRVTPWQQRRYVFRDESLAQVIGRFNSYRIVPIVIDSPQLAALQISGVFDLNDAESLMQYLSAFQGVTVTRLSDGTVKLSRQ